MFLNVSLQQIDEMLAGSLTQEDEDAVLAELEAITQVGLSRHADRKVTNRPSCDSGSDPFLSGRLGAS